MLLAKAFAAISVAQSPPGLGRLCGRGAHERDRSHRSQDVVVWIDFQLQTLKSIRAQDGLVSRFAKDYVRRRGMTIPVVNERVSDLAFNWLSIREEERLPPSRRDSKFQQDFPRNHAVARPRVDEDADGPPRAVQRLRDSEVDERETHAPETARPSFIGIRRTCNLCPHVKSASPFCRPPPAAGNPTSMSPANRRNSFTLAGPKPA